MSNRGLRVGVDIGGTFTDVTLLHPADGSLTHHKVPSTPSSPSDALIAGVGSVLDAEGAGPHDLEYLVHGTTLALNTLLQRRGARVALIVCHANRHVLDLARLRVPEQFSFTPRVPRPLVEPGLVRPIAGRMLSSGVEREPLDEQELGSLSAWLQDVGAEACAVALLNAYVNPAHEQRVSAAIRAASPELPVSTSADVWPEVREYERTMVTAMNAYVSPQMDAYFRVLRRQLAELGVDATPLITRSNGGLMSVDEAAELPVETLVSGPAAGVVGARFVAQSAGLRDCITFDMGGTSADVSVIEDGRTARSSEAHVGDFPVVIPAVDVTAIGAGGGSIAWLDRAGVLKVGPHSAGAEPGPACYGRGGEQPTVTDAYLLCGYLDPDRFAGGQITLRADLAEAAIDGIAQQAGMTPVEAAVAIVRIATVTMAAGLSPLMAGRGIDPRTFALLPYGGAGPLHANLLARELGMGRVLVPASPGTLCATGALINDLSRDWVRTFRGRVVPETLARARHAVRELETVARSWIAAQPIAVAESKVTFALDMRYVGQAYELEVEVDAARLDDADAVSELFHQRHHAVHRHADPSAGVEIVNLRAHAVGRTGDMAGARAGVAVGNARPCGTREIVLDDGVRLPAALYERGALGPGMRLDGPSIVEQEDTTVLILPAYTGVVDEALNLLIEATG